MINNIEKLITDFKSVLASLTVDQIEVLATLSSAINERLEELKEEIQNGAGEVNTETSQNQPVEEG